MMEILLILLAFVVGVGVGNRLLWWQLCRLWKRDAYAFRTVIEGVIALREERANREKTEAK